MARNLVTIFILSTNRNIFAIIKVDSRERRMALNIYGMMRPAIFALIQNPETAHILVLALLEQEKMTVPILRMLYSFSDKRLKQTVAGIDFPNPLGLAAGFTKSGKAVNALLALNFGHVEVGTVTGLPYAGNPSPNIFRLPNDEALFNHAGLPNLGLRVVAEHLEKHRSNGIVGMNIAATPGGLLQKNDAVEEVAIKVLETCALAYKTGISYIAINSCPNVEDSIGFNDPWKLMLLMDRIRSYGPGRLTLPTFLKVLPDDIGRIRELATICENNNIGLIIGNSSRIKPGFNLKTDHKTLDKFGVGHLSGRPIYLQMLTLVNEIAPIVKGSVPIIACGGIDSPKRAYNALLAGASLLQLYAGLIMKGPGIAKAILQGLVRIIEEEDMGDISRVIGAHWRYNNEFLPE